MDRDTIQKLASKKLFDKKRLMCLWCTGCGKSGIVIRFLNEHPDTKTLIVVPETNNIKNWYDEFEKFNTDSFHVTVTCYASLHKYLGSEYDLLVIDEAPHADTKLKIEQFKTIKAEYVLALGAVITQEEQETIERIYGQFVKSRISLQLAIEWGILPPPDVRVLHMELDNTKRDFRKNGLQLTEKGMYRLLDENVKKAKAEFMLAQHEKNRLKMQRAGLERKRFLGARKTEAIKRICESLSKDGKRFLCFCSSVSQAEGIGKDHAFTSKTPTSKKLLERFNNHEINSLYVVGKLIEGQTLVDIECGVLGQLGNSNRITVQSAGRIMRSKNPIIYVPVFDKTKDDKFLYTVTDNIPEQYIKHYKF